MDCPSPRTPSDLSESTPLTQDRDRTSKADTVDVQESELAASQISTPGRKAARTRIESVGVINLTILILSLLLTILFVWYIIFLWYFSPGLGFTAIEAPFWRYIVLRQWAEVSITISTAIFRAIAGLQLGVALSMIAAMMLEQRMVPVRFAPLVLTLRGSGTASTWAMLEYFFDLRAFRLSMELSYVAIFLLYTSLASQLSSTFLISDLGVSPVLGNWEDRPLAYALAEAPDGDQGTLRSGTLKFQQRTDDTQSWTAGSPSFPVFAEFSVPPTAPAGASGKDVWKYDTGLTMRAFLPFQEAEQRASIDQYKGYAAVFDTRTVCMTPPIDVRLDVGQRNPTSSNSGRFSAQLSGFVKPTLALPPPLKWRRGDEDSQKGLAFNCSVSFSGRAFEANADADWAITICNLNRTSLLMDSPILQASRFPDGIPTEQYILINATGTGEKWLEETSGARVPWQYSNRSEPWTRMYHPNHSDTSLDIAFCVNTVEPINIPTIITGGQPGRKEPIAVWDRYKRQYNTSSIVKLHAGVALGLDSQERGILRLEHGVEGSSNWTNGRTAARPFTLGAVDLKKFRKMWSASRDGDAGAMICTYCENYAASVIRAQRLHVLVFQDILKATGSLPLALQALLTTLTQRAWYDFLPEFDIAGNATYRLYGEKQIPVRRGGMIAVLLVVFAHNIAVLVVVWKYLFGNRQRLSMLGNLWQGFGQLVAGDVADLAASTTTALDKEVMRELKEDPATDDVVELVHDAEGGVLRLMRRRNGRIIEKGEN